MISYSNLTHSLTIGIRKRSAAMAAHEEDSVESEDDGALLMKPCSMKRRRTLDEAEEDLANTLGSDLPWLACNSHEPSRSPSHEHEGSSKALSMDEGDLFAIQTYGKY